MEGVAQGQEVELQRRDLLDVLRAPTKLAVRARRQGMLAQSVVPEDFQIALVAVRKFAVTCRCGAFRGHGPDEAAARRCHRRHPALHRRRRLHRRRHRRHRGPTCCGRGCAGARCPGRVSRNNSRHYGVPCHRGTVCSCSAACGAWRGVAACCRGVTALGAASCRCRCIARSRRFCFGSACRRHQRCRAAASGCGRGIACGSRAFCTICGGCCGLNPSLCRTVGGGCCGCISHAAGEPHGHGCGV
mmetsp:Transcript_160985/g.516739  ORF Transcript_160985/g.516739 Transcript_160985/m.516739 type:complete len:245 (+) Transcript_160985:1566-2300(+)